MKIFIDPGHGGTDPGAVAANGMKEATVNLDVSFRLGNIFENRGIQVMYSRTTDIFIPLGERAAMANEWGADYFVSIHCNSSADPQANGTETLFYKPGTTSEELARDVQTQLVLANKQRDRGIKQQNVAVLRLTNMPAVLAELAFISNPKEAELLSTADFRQVCAQGIADGFAVFLSGRLFNKYKIT